MAIVKMKRLRLVAMQADRSELFTKLQRLGCVEISQPDMDLSGEDMPALHAPDSAELSQARNRRQAADQALETLRVHSTTKPGLFPARPVITEKDLFNQSNLEKAWETIERVNSTKLEYLALQAEEVALQAKNESLIPWSTIDVPLDTAATKGVSVAFGTFPNEANFTNIQGAVAAVSDLAELTLASTGKDGLYVMMACYTPVLEEVMEALKDAGWSRANMRDLTGTAKENMDQNQRRLDEITKLLAEKSQRLAQMSEHRGTVQHFIDSTNQVISREEAKGRLLDTETAFYLEGWVVAERLAEVESMLGGYSVGYEVEEPKEEDVADVPVKLKNNVFSAPLSIVTEMYSLPAYNGIDPNPLMAPFFILFYGMMMADMGYGLVMILGCLFVLNKKPKGGMKDFATLFLMAGVSTFAWGAVTGGFFGDFIPQIMAMTGTLPYEGFVWFWPTLFTPLEDTLAILMGSMVLGAVHVLTGMMVSFCKKAKEGKFMDGVMDEGSWWLLFAGIGMGALGYGWTVCYAGVAALVLTQGRHNPNPVGKVVGGVASLYDITGYLGDILSYARLMALMLAGSVIAQVFNTLGSIPGNLFLFIIISFAGNTLNFLLNVLGCFVHDLRLQCLEFFNKFYQDGGRAFDPLEINTQYVDVQD